MNIKKTKLFIEKIKKLSLYKLKSQLKIGSYPNFFILGAQKAGTTSIYKYIENYGTNFKSPRSKELRYFSENYTENITQYKAFYPIKFWNNTVSGEATPDYLFYHKCPSRIKKHFPNSKFIVVLRDPIERAYSQYNHQNFTDKTYAKDPIPFSRAIRFEESRFDLDLESDFFYEYKYYSYKQRGLYEKQILCWLQYFPKENFMFVDTSELHCPNVIKNILIFLNIEFNENLNEDDLSSKFNTNNYEDITKDDYDYLFNYYKGKFNNLNKITGRDFSWLKKYQ